MTFYAAAHAAANGGKTARSSPSPTSPTGSRVRPTSALSYDYESTLADPRVGSPPPFEKTLDHAKINSTRHNGLRTNTFHTPSGIDKSSAPGDMFVRSLGKDIIKEVRAELQQATSIMHREISSVLEIFSKSRDDTKLTVAHILDRVEGIHRDSAKKSDLLEVHDELSLLHVGHREMAQRVDAQLTDNFSQVLEKVEEMWQNDQADSKTLSQVHEELQNVRQAGTTVAEVVQRSELQIDKLFKTQESLLAETEQSVQQLRIIQHESKQHQAGLLPCLEAQIQLQLQSMIDNFAQVCLDLGSVRKAASSGYVILGELRHMQQAMNLDFLASSKGREPVDEKCGVTLVNSTAPAPRASVSRVGSSGTHKKAANISAALTYAPGVERPESMGDFDEVLALSTVHGLRLREFWTQTDPPGGRDVCLQTENMPKDKKKLKHNRSDTFASALKSPVKPKSKKVFADAEAMKLMARQNLLQPYSVTDFYHNRGIAQAIARSAIFENTTFLVITLNALWIAVDTDLNEATVLIEADPVFQIAENSFCTYFTLELIVRFFAFKSKRNCLTDPWFVFDSILVSMMVIETWVITIVMLAIEGGEQANLGSMSILRMGRLVKMLRMTRVARLLRSVPELVILLKGLGVAARSVFFFFLLLLVIIYIYAVGFRQLTKNTDVGVQYFGSVPDAMQSLLLDGILPDNAGIVSDLGREHPMLLVAMLSFILLTTLTVMNMLVGVLVEVVGVVAATEKEGMAVSAVNYQLRDAMDTLGVSHDAQAILTKKQFLVLLAQSEVAAVLQEVGVDVMGLMDMADVIYEDNAQSKGASTDSVPDGTEGLSFADFIDVILNMRGTNPATVKDVEKQVRMLKGTMKSLMDELQVNIAYNMDLLRHQLEKSQIAMDEASDSE